MGKKVKEYKSGDFIFAKVKGYPAWPARVQKLNGKKYFVYFYGTGETANLPPNMIFDYAENKDKFLTKSVKRRDFNDGVKQIEYDFANNIPLEDVIGVNPEAAVESGNDTANDTANETMETTADTTAADDTVADTTVSTQNNTAIEDSDENVALVIDEGKAKAKKSKGEPSKTPAKETPAKETAKEVPAKTPKTPRGKPRKDEQKPDEEEEKRDEEIVSRSGRKIRPKRYMDEQTEENTTLPSPAPKRKRGASPAPDKDKATDKTVTKDQPTNKNIKHFNNVSQSVLEHLKEPFKPADADKDNLLMAYLPTAQYVGIKLFQSRPNSFKNDTSKLQWERQAASNAITLKMQLEKGDITTASIIAQLVMDLNLTDEEKARLDKERETDEKKHRVHFLKMEMRLIELDAKIKTCLCLEKADTTLCLELLDEFMKLELTPLMLLKHPTCLETVKRMRAYVGNTPSWDLSESDALEFSKQAHKIRKQADCLYKIMKDQFTVPEGLTFWEFFSERVLQFKKASAALHADQLLELVHMPLMMSSPTSHTTKAAIEAANDEESLLVEDEEPQKKKRDTQGKSKKSLNASTAQNNTPAKTPLKRQASRKQDDKEKTKDSNEKDKQTKEKDKVTKEKEKGTTEKEGEATTAEAEVLNESGEIPEEPAKESNPEESSKELPDTEAVTESESLSEPAVEPNTEIEEKESEDKSDNATQSSDKSNDIDKKSSDKADKKSNTTAEKSDKKATVDKPDKKIDKSDKKTNEKSDKKAEKSGKKSDKSSTDKSDDSNDKSDTTNEKESEKDDTNEIADKSEKEDKSSKEQKEKQDVDEPRAKRSRGETKKTETPPPRSPAKRKLKS